MTPTTLPAPPRLRADRPNHRVTASPRFRTERGALWLGLGLCFATLIVLRRADPR